MRIFEIAILCLVVAGLAADYFYAGKVLSAGGVNVKRLACGLLLFVVAAHLVWEGAHWQMAPAYLAVLLTVLLLLSPGLSKLWRICFEVTSLLLTVLGCGLSYVLPVFELPAPTGSFAIGTRIVSMVDSSRTEDALPGDGHQRELIVQIWYPATPSHNARVPYRRRSETSLASSYQSVDWTHSRYDAPLANANTAFPILLYNPGWNGRRTQNTALIEDLASHGYVVAAIDHPYNSGPVALADGRVIKPLPSPELSDDVTPAAAVYALIDKEVAKETNDTLFVLNQIERMKEDSASPFFHRLDTSKIGALGYSLGGAVSAEAAYRDTRIRAVLDLDTPLYGESEKHGIAQPILLIREELTRASDEELARMSFGKRRDIEMDEGDYARQFPILQTRGSYQIMLRGTLHTSFQDVIFTSPLQRFSGAGAIPAERINRILRQYALAFFDQSLRGIASPLLAARSSPFAEVTVLYNSSPDETPTDTP